MRAYFKTYRNRLGRIAVTVALTITVLLIGCLLLHINVVMVSKQLETYHNADFSHIYVLNYKSELDNECIFADTDISIFKDQKRTSRLAVSTIMKSSNTTYCLKALEDLSKLQDNEVLLSENVSKDYGIQKGDVVYVSFPFQNEMIAYNVAGVVDFNLDYLNPNVDNSIGLVYLGFNEDYSNNIKCKYMLFANQSKTEYLSEKAQILDNIIYKSSNEKKMLKQGLSPIAIYSLCAISGIILSNIILFSKSRVILRRCYLKGMRRCGLFILPALEKIVFNLIPVSIFAYVYAFTHNDCGRFICAFSLIPVCISIIFIVGTLVLDIAMTRQRGD